MIHLLFPLLLAGLYRPIRAILPTPMVSYNFTNCRLPNTFPFPPNQDTLQIGTMSPRYSGYVACGGISGIRAVPGASNDPTHYIVESNTLDHLREPLKTSNDTAFSVSITFRPGNVHSSAIRPILSIGNNGRDIVTDHGQPDNYGWTKSAFGCSSAGMILIYQVGASLAWHWGDYTDLSRGTTDGSVTGHCRQYVLDGNADNPLNNVKYGESNQLFRHSAASVPWNYTMREGEPIQLIIAFDNKTVSAFVNGETIVSRAKATNHYESIHSFISHWQINFAIQLFYTYRLMDQRPDEPWLTNNTEVFDGSIAEYSLWNAALTADDAHTLFQNSLPVVPSEPDIATSSPWSTPTVSPIGGGLGLNLQATDKIVLVAQGSLDGVKVPLVSLNASSPSFPIEIEVTALPKHGKLWRWGTGVEVLLGDRFLVGSGKNLAVDFFFRQTDDDFFNLPAFDYHGKPVGLHADEVLFRLVAIDADGIEFFSGIFSQPIDVYHTMHPATIKAPAKAVYDPKYAPYFFIDGIEIDDRKDRDVDRVRVEILANYGNTSLNEDYLHLIRDEMVEGCGRRDRWYEWQCLGDGLDDQYITFIATPSEANLILSRIKYEILAPTLPGNITIRVHDGVGGDCLNLEEHLQGMGASSLRASMVGLTAYESPGCWTSEVVIEIPFIEDLVDFGWERDNNIWGIPNTDFSNMGWPDIIYWTFIFTMIGCICCCGYCSYSICFKHCRARGGIVHVDGSQVFEDVESGLAMEQHPSKSTSIDEE